ncbi:MAG: hypothetical protein RLZZ176_1226 [Cyanobacteriota bacterium]
MKNLKAHRSTTSIIYQRYLYLSSQIGVFFTSINCRGIAGDILQIRNNIYLDLAQYTETQSLMIYGLEFTACSKIKIE